MLYKISIVIDRICRQDIAIMGHNMLTALNLCIRISQNSVSKEGLKQTISTQ